MSIETFMDNNSFWILKEIASMKIEKKYLVRNINIKRCDTLLIYDKHTSLMCVRLQYAVAIGSHYTGCSLVFEDVIYLPSGRRKNAFLAVKRSSIKS